MTRAKIVDYFDVWGNKRDGYEINNMCVWREIEVKDVSSRGLVQAMKREGYLKPSVRMNMLDVWQDGGPYYEFYERKTGIPVCRVEVEDD